MSTRRKRANSSEIFINVPYDQRYERLFVALLGTLIVLGRSPRCVIEIPVGPQRISKIFDLIQKCGTSIHDLSRVTGTPPRFNMPFELGLAYAAHHIGEHEFTILEEERHRFQRSLSDLSGYDPQIHDGTLRGMVRCVLNLFASTSANPTMPELLSFNRDLWKIVLVLKKQIGVNTIFDAYIYRTTVSAAVELARRRSWIS